MNDIFQKITGPLKRINSVQASSEKCEDSSKNYVRPSQLPLYKNSVENLEYEIVYKPVTPFEENISVVRKAVVGNLAKVEDTRLKVVHVIDTGVAHTQAMYEYLTDDDHMIPRAVAITVGGLAGLLTAARGGLVKRITYSSLGMLGVASLCYPKQTVNFTMQSYESVKEKGLGVFSDAAKPLKNWTSETFGFMNAEPTKIETVGEENKDADKAEDLSSLLEGDAGQSNPADKDLYTTRS